LKEDIIVIVRAPYYVFESPACKEKKLLKRGNKLHQEEEQVVAPGKSLALILLDAIIRGELETSE
jgi:hypothetical protein